MINLLEPLAVIEKVMESAEKRGSLHNSMLMSTIFISRKCVTKLLLTTMISSVRLKNDTPVLYKNICNPSMTRRYLRKDYEGWYSVSVEKFWTEKDLSMENARRLAKMLCASRRKLLFQMSKYQMLCSLIRQTSGYGYQMKK